MIRWKHAVDRFPDFGMTFDNPDFVAFARAHNANGRRVEARRLAPAWRRRFRKAASSWSSSGRLFRECPRARRGGAAITRRLRGDEATVPGSGDDIDVHHWSPFLVTIFRPTAAARFRMPRSSDAGDAVADRFARCDPGRPGCRRRSFRPTGAPACHPPVGPLALATGFRTCVSQLALRDSVSGRSSSTRSCITFGVMRPRSPRSRRISP